MPISSPGFNTRRISYSLARSLRVDIALFVCALFVQRFTLVFPGGKVTSLSIAPAVLILVHEFAFGRLLVQYDRLLWFLALALAATSSLVLNFNRSSPTSYGLFLVIYFFLTFRRSSSTDRYRETLKGFQSLILILCSLAIMQFPAQFIVNPRTLLMFFWIFPTSILPYNVEGGLNTMGIVGASGLKQANGIFLGEASILSQMAAFAILIEVLEFRRPRYLIVLTIGFLLAYGGTGASILLISLPLAFIHNRRAQMPLLLVSLFAVGLFATGVIHLSAFTSRLGEFQNTGASGFIRFVSPLWQAADYLDTASLTELLFGNGPGYGSIHRAVFYAVSSDTWFKLFLEYGLVGAFLFACFLGACLRRSRCPMPLIAGIVFNYLFTGNSLLDPSSLIIIAVLCTLNGPEPVAEPGKLIPTRSTSAIPSSAS
jgi:hypothetical protein